MEHLAWLRNRGYTQDSAHPFYPELDPLKARLLAYGGHAVILHHHEPDLDKIMDRGVIADGANAMLILGEPRACHDNSLKLALGYPKITLCTGYALSADGLWRQHSWCRDDWRLVETTESRVAYFGVALTEEETLAWAAD